MNLQDLAEALKVKLHGDPECSISGLAPIDRAGQSELAFVVSPRYAAALRASEAGAVIVPESMRSLAPGNCLVSDNPYASYAQASWLLTPETPLQAQVHASACIDPTADVAASAYIGPGVVIGAYSTIGVRQCHSVRQGANGCAMPCPVRCGHWQRRLRLCTDGGRLAADPADRRCTHG